MKNMIYLFLFTFSFGQIVEAQQKVESTRQIKLVPKKGYEIKKGCRATAVFSEEKGIPIKMCRRSSDFKRGDSMTGKNTVFNFISDESCASRCYFTSEEKLKNVAKIKKIIAQGYYDSLGEKKRFYDAKLINGSLEQGCVLYKIKYEGKKNHPRLYDGCLQLLEDGAISLSATNADHSCPEKCSMPDPVEDDLGQLIEQ